MKIIDISNAGTGRSALSMKALLHEGGRLPRYLQQAEGAKAPGDDGLRKPGVRCCNASRAGRPTGWSALSLGPLPIS